MAVGIFTSRVVLQTLGVEDYGIYNVVGELVAMFSIVACHFGAITMIYNKKYASTKYQIRLAHKSHFMQEAMPKFI